MKPPPQKVQYKFRQPNASVFATACGIPRHDMKLRNATSRQDKPYQATPHDNKPLHCMPS